MNAIDTPRTYAATRRYDGKTAECRRQERKRQLIDSAIKLIGSSGYAALSLNGLCADAALTKRYFYESFDNIESVLAAAFRQISHELQVAVIEGISSQNTPRTMIAAGFHAFFAYIRNNPEKGRVYLVEALSVNSLRAELHGSGGGDVSRFLLDTTADFLADDSLPDSILTIMAQGTVGAAIFVGQNWIASGYRQPIEELVRGVSEICFGTAERLNISLDTALS